MAKCLSTYFILIKRPKGQPLPLVTTIATTTTALGTEVESLVVKQYNSMVIAIQLCLMHLTDCSNMSRRMAAAHGAPHHLLYHQQQQWPGGTMVLNRKIPEQR